MKAVGFLEPLDISHPESLLDIELPVPTPSARDLLVRIEAISVNPVDTKIRKHATPSHDQYQILGWDAAGVVESVGPGVLEFKPGDKVFYAGAIDRPGSNAEYQLVDERIVGKMPRALDFKQAAALPLTSITAWELMFDRLNLNKRRDSHLLIIGAAGGVGSIMIQLAKQLTAKKVIATASRPETQAWVKELGADFVIDHSRPLADEVAALDIGLIENVVSLTHTDKHMQDISELIAPQGKLGMIDDPEEIDIKLLKRKSVTICWEFMFTRSLFETPDMKLQHHLLTEISRLVNERKIQTTLTEDFGKINAENLKKAHALIESGKSKGKIVLAGF